MASLLGAGYESSDDDTAPSAPQTQPPVPSATKIVAAPEVNTEDQAHMQMMLANTSSTALTYNATYDDLSRPSQGPANPFKPAGAANGAKRKNVPTGYAEEAAISEAMFTAQHRTFQSLGYTRNPTVPEQFVGNLAHAAQFGGRDVIQMKPSKEVSAALRAKRQKKGDSSIVEGEGAYLGPWAKYQSDNHYYEDAEAVEGAEDRELASDEEYVYEDEADAAAAPPSHIPAAMDKLATDYQDDTGNAETTEFHGSEQFDYLGRTYMHIPQDLDIDLRKEPGSTKNFIPKKLIHTYKSHTKAITSLRFFPRAGHLLLSSAADGQAKIWDAYHSRELLRTFSGHSKAITDTDFHPTGTTFLTASYDRQIKLWDTEYGKCVGRFSTGKTPHVVRFNPSPELSHEFLAGMSDKKIVQFDTRSGELVQEYDHHLAAINTITFVDDNRRFISTSDDKSLRAWEYGIPVPIKFIAEPYMFALTRAAPHPNGKYVAFQSGDNQIVVYGATDKFRQNRKKSFRGHNNAGYGIDIKISPDGQFLVSGDSAGYVCFWDWKTGKMYHKIMAGGKEGGATTCLDWHPQETSKVVTGGLDGIIRYWD
ncbi:WD40 repeat domain-containing protein [Aspergillus homomorphus CBS 101889]|uniref:Putative mRNA splicing factor n=1 Tax=Aspergillus homomorphus (strain CBS 101889) TaxID=1450537 RepID=A0A395HWY6_ASPHC|nr:putative mRNA splicing factor [Aspergillus homomorphus CBS 101889]RAL11368.1 putative mRNA splicing factor [Aspergillus homomorphus CBS 101889]